MENNLGPAIFMLAICFGMVAVMAVALKKFFPSILMRFIVIAVLWFAATGLLAAAGFFKVFGLPPRIPVVVILPVIATLIFSFTKRAKELLRAVPVHLLMMIQSFRIVVEIWLWYSLGQGIIPEQMTFEGRNFDILSGVLGLVAGWLVMNRGGGWKAIAVVYNLVGLGLLLNIVIVAVLSFPGPTRYFMNEPANVIVADFPFIYLPAVLVVLAFVFHILSLRQVAVAPK